MSKNLWKDLQRELERQLEPDEFSTWFRPLRVQREEPDKLVLVAPNDHFLNALEQSYRPAVDRAIAGLRGPGFRVLFALGGKAATQGDRTPLQLNPKYLFENFVVGSSNQFAHAAARAVAESPAHSYNPLFLYGGVGLGKTHLLHAIGHDIARRQGHLRVLYLAAEQFVNELINSIRFDRMPAFRERYRTIDVLLIDDIQFIGNKERTQEEFFHTFNTLYTAQKQIILTSDAPPRSIPALEERLRSRFEWGLIADIQPPELETKIVILRRKAEAQGLELPDDVGLFLAQQVRSNVRELEGLLTRVLGFSALTGRPLSLDLAKETLRDILPEADRRVAAGDVIKLVARHYGLKVSEIKSKSNAKQIAFPRQVAMWMCKQLTELSYPDIGRQFNDKHHSTVMYSVEKIEKLRATDGDFAQTLDRMVQHFS
jgi:chromosomal replication initiator protein